MSDVESESFSSSLLDEFSEDSSDDVVSDDDPYSTDPLPLHPPINRDAVVREVAQNDDFRCLCGVCSPEQPDEYLCCTSVSQVAALCDSAGVRCITEHRLFHDFCLRREMLAVNARQYCRYDYRLRLLDPTDNRCLRFTAYSIFASWVWGYLGPRNRRQIPGCAVRAIRREHPSPSYQGFLS
ncbi:uncharacterized protein LOC135387095 [Ornithodoros turicata]|uniref:uncharacterized protein LOC135376629 n=1 Tax=Ornithodoros turicata TaxID=34597 RepID=UPI00313A431C